MGVAPCLAPWAVVGRIWVWRVVRQPALNIGEVVENLMVDEDVIANHVVIAVQHRRARSTVGMSGHVNKPHPRVFAFKLAHHIQILLHCACIKPGHLPTPGPHEGIRLWCGSQHAAGGIEKSGWIPCKAAVVTHAQERWIALVGWDDPLFAVKL